MPKPPIKLLNARKNNLKIDQMQIEHDQLIVITGPSGSGKSSLALGTIYAEGYKRYVSSLSSYARQFLSVLPETDVDSIEGLPPAIAIEQKATSHNPRSTVGTVTEIYDYVRLLYARIGIPHCPTHQISLAAFSISQIVDLMIEKHLDEKVIILAPLKQGQSGAHDTLIQDAINQGFVRARLNGNIQRLTEMNLDPKKKNTLELVIDRLTITKDQQRLADSLELCATHGNGRVLIHLKEDQEDLLYSTNHACSQCGFSIDKLEPKLFSFNSPIGACQSCDGLGMRRFIKPNTIITNDHLSLKDGALRFWDTTHKHYWAVLESVAKHLQISTDTPWKELDPSDQTFILYGSKQRIKMTYPNIYGKPITRIKVFEGAIPNLERRYQETETLSVKESIGKLLAFAACTACNGSRLNEKARHVLIHNQSIESTVNLPIDQLHTWSKTLSLTTFEAEIAAKILTEIQNRTEFLMSVGLNYLFLNRAADTLSGGEAQRIRLASQIGSGLVGVMYVLDEPSIGLHMRDNQRLINTLTTLRDLGNTVIVVEHDEDTMHQADIIYDIGPGAGVHGGEITAIGNAKHLEKDSNSLTGQYLSGQKQILVPKKRQPVGEKWIKILGAKCHNLKNVDVHIPIGLITCISGVSGSGKSTLISNTLHPYVHNALFKSNWTVGECDQITGIEHIDKIIDIDQSPIGRTPRSNPATYTGLFSHIRDLFSQTEEARSRGYQPGRFSFNVKGGRCEACNGDGLIKVEMHFLSDVYVTCSICDGKRFNRETLAVTYKGLNIHEVLNLTIEEAIEVFKNIPKIYKKLQTLADVGLHYIKLGQSATTLSGGEAQRIKLAKELAKRSTGQTLFILDEPTTGLHFHDIAKLMQVIQSLRKQGNTVVIIEHNIDVLKIADWIIDIGPEGGTAGGKVVAYGTPEEVAASKASHTAPYLHEALSKSKLTDS
ncbi:excinuclease ABC subunit UvrA [Gammaproteobacteria bacterium]|nr:excinuclease ABC subunit UvrA [Gammaproteobacteria bacterium]